MTEDEPATWGDAWASPLRATTHRVPPPAPQPARPRRSLVTSLVIVGLLGAAVAADRLGLTESMGLKVPLTGRLAGVHPPGWPTPGVEEAATPLGQPPSVVTESRSYTFEQTQADGTTPVAFDPCRPVHYVIQQDGAPPEGAELVSAAVADVAAATGLTFVFDGATDEPADWDRPLTDPERYGDRWAPVLIAWTTPEHNADLEGDILGQGGGIAAQRRDGTLVFVSGQVQLDAAQFAEVVARRGGPTSARLAIEHELAHVVGLGHTDDPTQVMYHLLMPPLIGFGAGDLTGLARLGAGTCAPDL